MNYKLIYFLIAIVAIAAVLYPVAYAELTNSSTANNPLGCEPLLPCGQLNPASGVCHTVCYVYMSDATFLPNTINVTIGAQIVWINNDSVTHFTASTDGKTWASNPIPPGQQYVLDVSASTFKVGTSYYYYCKIHTQMIGLVNVVG